MFRYATEQVLRQLDARKGGYFYLELTAEIVNQLPKKRATRLLCTVDDEVTYRCGLNHVGNGNFFIILAGKYLKLLRKKPGDAVRFRLEEDPNPLGVELPEVLEALLEQDEALRKNYDALSDGRKRSLIHTVNRVKDLDKQVQTAVAFLHTPKQPRRRKEEGQREWA